MRAERRRHLQTHKEGLNKFTSHVPFLWKLLEIVLYKNEAISQARGNQEMGDPTQARGTEISLDGVKKEPRTTGGQLARESPRAGPRSGRHRGHRRRGS